jgi:hypothetical protein
LKEALVELGHQVQGTGKQERVSKVNFVPVKNSSDQGSFPTTSLLGPILGSEEKGEGVGEVGEVREVVPASRTQFLVEFYARKKSTNIGHGKVQGMEGRVNHEGMSAFIANKKL